MVAHLVVSVQALLEVMKVILVLGRLSSVDYRDPLAFDPLMDHVFPIHVISPLSVLRLFRCQIIFPFVMGQLGRINHTSCGLEVELVGCLRDYIFL